MTGMTDIHCHILPGVDDGAGSMEMALQMLKAEKMGGVERVVLTPHCKKRGYETSLHVVYNRYDQLLDRASSLGMKLLLGSEIEACSGLPAFLDERQRLTLAGTKYVMIEFQEEAGSDFILERAGELLRAGYTPIIARCERLRFLTRGMGLIEELWHRGCRMEITSGTLLGLNGLRARRFAKKLIANEFLDYIGTDMRDPEGSAASLAECEKKLVKWVGESYARRILCDNPEEIFQDERTRGAEV